MARKPIQPEQWELANEIAKLLDAYAAQYGQHAVLWPIGNAILGFQLWQPEYGDTFHKAASMLQAAHHKLPTQEEIDGRED